MRKGVSLLLVCSMFEACSAPRGQHSYALGDDCPVWCVWSEPADGCYEPNWLGCGLTTCGCFPPDDSDDGSCLPGGGTPPLIIGPLAAPDDYEDWFRALGAKGTKGTIRYRHYHTETRYYDYDGTYEVLENTPTSVGIRYYMHVERLFGLGDYILDPYLEIWLVKETKCGVKRDWLSTGQWVAAAGGQDLEEVTLKTGSTKTKERETDHNTAVSRGSIVSKKSKATYGVDEQGRFFMTIGNRRHTFIPN